MVAVLPLNGPRFRCWPLALLGNRNIPLFSGDHASLLISHVNIFIFTGIVKEIGSYRFELNGIRRGQIHFLC